jgi:hypothetical protein
MIAYTNSSADVIMQRASLGRSQKRGILQTRHVYSTVARTSTTNDETIHGSCTGAAAAVDMRLEPEAPPERMRRAPRRLNRVASDQLRTHKTCRMPVANRLFFYHMRLLCSRLAYLRLLCSRLVWCSCTSTHHACIQCRGGGRYEGWLQCHVGAAQCARSGYIRRWTQRHARLS